MKLLVVHTWLRGNLGDVLQGSVLLRALRELRPSALDLAGYPSVPSAGARELLELADRHLPEPFLWTWRFLPAAVRARTVEPGWRQRRTKLFARYDAIVSAPGPFLASYDARASGALADLDLAAELGIPFLLASHSVGPLSAAALRSVARASLCVAREDRTFEYLVSQGQRPIRSADLAFLYPYDEALARGSVQARFEGPYRLLFLRARNLRRWAVARTSTQLRCGARHFSVEPQEQLVVATSDAQRDARFVAALARQLGARSVICRSVPDLVALIAGSSGVISDRYHPAICAAVLGKPTDILPNHEPHKMQGLEGLLRGSSVEDLRELSRAGLNAVGSTLRRSVRTIPDSGLA